MAETYVAFLRGVNVGGKNKLPMEALKELFVNAGCGNVRTYIQSGNVIFSSSTNRSSQLPKLIAAAIEKQFGYRTPVVLRTASQMRKVVRSNPFLARADEDKLHVLFLADTPAVERLRGLDANRSQPDHFEVRGQEVYLFLPNGVARTKLTNDYFDTKLATTSTGRNWRTVTKLLELMES